MTEEVQTTPEVDNDELRRKEFVKTLMTALERFPNAPKEEEIAGWKNTYGEVYATGMGEDDVFIFRPLARFEHKDILNGLQRAATPETTPADTESQFKDRVVATCLVWSSNPTSIEKKGGTVETLFEQIMSRSNFVAPNIATQLVFKL